MADNFVLKDSKDGLYLYQWAQVGTYYLCATEKPTLTLLESWALPGLYLFATGAEPSALLAGCIPLWQQEAERLRILWVENPEDSASLWRYHAILWDKKGKTSGQWGFRLSEYYLNLFCGASISALTDELHIKGCTSEFQTPHTKFELSSTIVLPLSSGALKFEMYCPASSENLFALLDAGMVYALTSTESDEQAFERGFLDTAKNNLLFYQQPMSLFVHFDPCRPMNEDATYFSLPQHIELTTSFSDIYGVPLTARTTNTTRLVFQQTPRYRFQEHGNAPTAKIQHYLGLAGQIEFSSTREQIELLCGLTGIESIRGESRSFSVCFNPNGNAFLDENGHLTSDGTAPWVSLPAGSLYLSQPEGSPFFTLGANSVLPFRPVAQCRITTKQGAVPMFPHQAARWNVTEKSNPTVLETALQACRHARLSGLPQNLSQGEEILAVSPQGLLLCLDGDGLLSSWQWLAFGRGTSGDFLRIWGMDSELRTKFQDPSMTCVFRNKSELLNHISRLDGFQLDISGWIFQANPEQWRDDKMGDTATCMVMKYSIDLSLRTVLEKDAVFQKSLRCCYTETGEIRAEYTSFLQWIDDPLFQGCLLLNCPLDTCSGEARMLPEARQLLNGVEDSERAGLFAHHVLIGKSRLTADSLHTSRSPISALVEYTGGVADSYNKEQNAPPDAKFVTRSFLLSIEHSEITVLNSVSELVLNRLFGTPCFGDQRDSGSSLVVDGVLRTENGASLFDYRLRDGASYALGGMLERVAITALRLSCGETTSTFYLEGRLLFAAQSGCDLFSYGSVPPNKEISEQADDDGLVFSGLEIELGKKDIPPEFRYQSIALSPLASHPREQSLAARFPSEVIGLWEDRATTSPEERGYVLLQCPMRQAPLHTPWYGLRWRIPLGSLGDLSQTGALDMELLTAWSTTAASGNGESTEPGCWLGVRLPSALGGSGLDLQGLLKLGFSSVDMLTQEDDTQRLHYSLRLNQFAIKVLGITFPPGSNQISIVADEAGKQLGWYAAYLDEDEQKLK